MPRLDLNLVRVLVAIYETRSVTAAAERLSLTQPTVSYGLAKLRETYGDRLFLRGPAGLAPTATAELVYRRFSQALAAVDSTLEDPQQFDPRRSARRFRVAMSDIGALYFLPPLYARLQQLAPNVELEVVQVAMDQVVDDLASGRLDVAVGNLPAIRAHTRSTLLFLERYTCLLARDHPRIGDALTLEAFVAARHVMVASPFSGHRLVDDALAERGVSREIAVRIPHFTVLPQLVSHSELLVTLPSRVAQLYAAQGPLKSLDLPVPIPEFEVRVHWHGRHEASPSHKWLVAQIIAALGVL